MRCIFSWYVICIYVIFLIVFSVIPLQTPVVTRFILFDKIIHFFIYCLFAFIVFNTLIDHKFKNCRMKSLLGVILFGVILECIQIFLPFRSFEASDIVANCLGALAGISIKVVSW